MKKELEKNSFRDSKGNIWTFRVTAKTALGLKNNFGFDVRDIEDAEKLDSICSGDLEILQLMAFVLAPQLEMREMSASDLYESMGGDEVAEASWAFVYGCIFFFPPHTRNPMEAWAGRVRTTQSQSGSLMTQRIQSQEMTAELESLLQSHVEKI